MADLHPRICEVCRRTRTGHFVGFVCVNCYLTREIALLSAQLADDDIELSLAVEVLQGVHRRLQTRVTELQARAGAGDEAGG